MRVETPTYLLSPINENCFHLPHFYNITSSTIMVRVVLPCVTVLCTSHSLLGTSELPPHQKACQGSSDYDGVKWKLKCEFIKPKQDTFNKSIPIKQRETLETTKKEVFKYVALVIIPKWSRLFCYLVHCSMIERMNCPMRAKNCCVYLEWNCLSRVSRPSTSGGQSTGSVAFLQVIPGKTQDNQSCGHLHMDAALHTSKSGILMEKSTT